MNYKKLALLTAIIAGGSAGAQESRQAIYQPSGHDQVVQQVGCNEDADCGCEAPSCGAEEASCDDSGCDSMGCDSACSSSVFSAGLFANLRTSEVGEPWTLFGEHCGWSAGGWTDIGYHSNNTQFNFNNYANKVQLQQQWLWAQKAADGSEGLGIGGRIDYLYGTDAPDTQSFGIANNHWDNGWENNQNKDGYGYGQAIPQAYFEVAYGDTSVKLGHFFTIIGNEVVQATGNFFYSRQFTFYNAEPFTHTGVLATQTVDDNITLYGGYVLGWDSGFEDNGDAFIGGMNLKLNDATSFIYTTAIGRFNDDPASTNFGERGSIHSFILNMSVTDKLTALVQYDLLDTDNAAGANVRSTDGVIGYLIYQLTDRLAVGSRTEYFDANSVLFNPGVKSQVFNETFGFNYKVNGNLMLRPEMRYIDDKDQAGILQHPNGNTDRTNVIFGMDAVYTF